MGKQSDLFRAYGLPDRILSDPGRRPYEGDVPGASAKECGNYLDLNLPMAKYVAGKYLDEVLTGLTPDRLKYS